MMIRLFASILICITSVIASSVSAVTTQPVTAIYDVQHFGATGDGSTLDTKAIQSAIDKASSTGGGVVLFSKGRFLTGTIYIKSNVTLQIEKDATLLGSAHINDYTTDTDRTMYRGEPYMNRCLIFASDAKNIGIQGAGTIDGQGKSFPERGDRQRNRPKLIRFLNCTGIHVRQINLLSPASWTNEWRYCSDIDVDGMSVVSRANSNGDGLDLDGCTNVKISNCTFDTSDDSICLQTSLTDHPCRNVTVTKCSFTSRWAGLRIGLLSRGDFEDVHVSDCTFTNHNDSGLKIQMNEGGEMKDMTFSQLTMKNVPRPVFLTSCQKNAWVDSGDELPPMKKVSGLHFDHIQVDNEVGNKNAGFMITGMPGHPVEDITFSHIQATFSGSGSLDDAKSVLVELTPEDLATRWPEYSMLHGTVPSFGIYARHVKGLVLEDIDIKTAKPDARPPIVFVDVQDDRQASCPAPVKQ